MRQTAVWHGLCKARGALAASSSALSRQHCSAAARAAGGGGGGGGRVVCVLRRVSVQRSRAELPLPAAQDKDKPILFSMARLDTVKNLTGLAEWFGRNKRLRKAGQRCPAPLSPGRGCAAGCAAMQHRPLSASRHRLPPCTGSAAAKACLRAAQPRALAAAQVANLVLVAGIVDPEQSNDREEKAQCQRVRPVPCRPISVPESCSCPCCKRCRCALRVAAHSLGMSLLCARLRRAAAPGSWTGLGTSTRPCHAAVLVQVAMHARRRSLPSAQSRPARLVCCARSCWRLWRSTSCRGRCGGWWRRRIKPGTARSTGSLQARSMRSPGPGVSAMPVPRPLLLRSQLLNCQPCSSQGAAAGRRRAPCCRQARGLRAAGAVRGLWADCDRGHGALPAAWPLPAAQRDPPPWLTRCWRPRRAACPCL